MLQTIRDRVSSWIAYTIIGLIILSFALWGIGSYFGEPTTPDVAEVKGNPITLREFQQAFQQQRQQFPETDIAFLKAIVLQQLISERLLLETAQEQGLRVDDQLLRQAILSYQVFQEDGVFNSDRYKQMLALQGLTEQTFEESLRRNLMVDQLREGLTTTAMVTPAQIDQYIRLLKQQRELQYVLLPLKEYVDKTTVEETAVREYFEENKARFVNPEQVKVRYLELDLEKIAEDIPVSDTDLKAAYQENISRYTQPETRSASHILVTAPTDASETAIETARTRAQSIYNDITSGEKTFQEASTELQDDNDIETGELGEIRKGMYDENPTFEATLYSLQNSGDVSEPVQTEFGFHILRLDAIEPEKNKPLAEVRDEVAQELRLRKAENRFYDLSENLANLIYEHPNSLEPAAQALGLEVQESPWFTRQEGEGIAVYPGVVEAAFSQDVLKNRFNSDLIELKPNHVVVVRADDHKQATPQTLQEARSAIVSELKQQQARETMLEDAKALEKRATKGESLTKLAKEFGGELKKPGLVERQASELDPTLLNSVFSLPQPAKDKASFGLAALNDGQAVIAVERVVPGKPDAVTEQERELLTQQLAGRSGSSVFDSFLTSLREQADIVTYNERL
jgi:peptidyl-prolyl cis-trans isomerase D